MAAVTDDEALEIMRNYSQEIERLRAALKEIADDPGGYPAEEAFNEVREIARKALNLKP